MLVCVIFFFFFVLIMYIIIIIINNTKHYDNALKLPVVHHKIYQQSYLSHDIIWFCKECIIGKQLNALG